MALASSWKKLSQVRRGRPGDYCVRGYSPSGVGQYLQELPGPSVLHDRIGTCDVTMAALLSVVSPGASWTVYSQCWMQQQDLYTLVVVRPCFTNAATFTGCVTQNALNFVLLFLCSTAATGQRLHTWQETYLCRVYTSASVLYSIYACIPRNQKQISLMCFSTM